MHLDPLPEEKERRRSVLSRILDHIRSDTRITLPPFEGKSSTPSDYALLAIAGDGNAFSGSVGAYRYQFEGEDDLLHLFVVRGDGGPLTVEDAQSVVSFLLQGVPPALIWLRPGSLSQHFYVGHDELLNGLVL